MTLGAWRNAARRPLAKRVEVRAQFALVESGLALRMDELDRVFQRDDVDGLGLVDLVQHRGQRRGFAGAGGAGDEHQAGFLARESA